MRMKRAEFTEEELQEIWAATEEADAASALPMSYIGRRTEAASKVDAFLRNEKAPMSVMDAFELICEELGITYLASIRKAEDASLFQSEDPEP